MNNRIKIAVLPNRKTIWLLTLMSGAILLGINARSQTKHIDPESQPTEISSYYQWWNLIHYTIAIQPDYVKKFIHGTNQIAFKVTREGQVMRVDLKDPMRITRVTWRNTPLTYKKVKNAYLITFPQILKKGLVDSIKITFQGTPAESHKPPFDNGWIWQKDNHQNPWISVACEGSGASIWLPCKEVLYDEPDKGVRFNIKVPDSLVAVSNGRLTKKTRKGKGFTTFQWEVASPINNYNIIPYIGKYVHWHTIHHGVSGNLDLDFWVLSEHQLKAKEHFKQVDTMLNCFEYWLGKYPFYKDGFKMVEAPMPGMEHQSAIAYGNKFENGYNGYDISGTGWGLKWDFILVHESSHEWFGNSITSCDNSNTWLHEGFAKYMETIYTDYVFGHTAGNAYCIGTWKKIKNDEPIIGNNTSDKYYKASAMLHMIRQITGDKVFRGWLHQLNRVFYHHTVNTDEILACLNDYTAMDFTDLFQQYLNTIQVPDLEYYTDNNQLHFRWANCVKGFSMPVKIRIGLINRKIHPTAKWKAISIDTTKGSLISVDSNYYVNSHRMTANRLP